MKKLRRIGQCLRLIGDDLERRSLHGSGTEIIPRDVGVTSDVINISTHNNTDIDVAANNARNMSENNNNNNNNNNSDNNNSTHVTNGVVRTDNTDNIDNTEEIGETNSLTAQGTNDGTDI